MKKEIKRILYISLSLNILLATIKITSGLLGNSKSLLSDGINSLTDVFISLLLIIIIYISSKKPDKNHQYGHEKYEGIISLVLGIIVTFTALFIGIDAVKSFSEDKLIPKNITIYVAIFSVFVKVLIYFINYRGYKKYQRASLKADAYNHLGDIFATISSLVGIILSKNGFAYFDNIASIIIALFIAKSGIEIMKEAVSYLVDEAPSKELINSIRELIKNIEGVITIDDLKARKHMNKIYVDVEIGVNKELTVVEAHIIAENVHLLTEKEFKSVIHVMVHVNPK